MEEAAKINFHFPGQSVHNIPENSGVYAWHAPLYFFDNTSPREAVEFYNRLFLWELGGDSKGKVHAELAWKRIQLKLKPHERHDPLEKKEVAETLEKEDVQKWLKCAGIFTPPLYVGRATNLRARYQQHSQADRDGTGDFAGRFGNSIKQLNLTLRVSSLIFGYVETGLTDNENHVIESFLMRAAMPPFSKQ